MEDHFFNPPTPPNHQSKSTYDLFIFFSCKSAHAYVSEEVTEECLSFFYSHDPYTSCIFFLQPFDNAGYPSIFRFPLPVYFSFSTSKKSFTIYDRIFLFFIVTALEKKKLKLDFS